MPKLLFFLLFFIGTMGGVWVVQTGLFGPGDNGLLPQGIGFAFAIGIAFILFAVLRLTRWFAAFRSPTTRQEAQIAASRFLQSRLALIGVAVLMFYASMIGGAFIIHRDGWPLLAFTVAVTIIGTTAFSYLVRRPLLPPSRFSPSDGEKARGKSLRL